jgi:ribosomal protein S18 acetylase RimI-like enzyme
MRVRPAIREDALCVAAIHVASWQTAFRGLMPDEFLDSQSLDECKKGWERNIAEHPGNLIVVEDRNGEVQGFSCNGRRLPESSPISDYEGQIYGIHVSPAKKERGLGFLLMQASFDRLASLGYANAHLWTLEGNLRARRFYEGIGGRVIGSAIKNFGGRELVEIAYGWDTLKLTPRSASETK